MLHLTMNPPDPGCEVAVAADQLLTFARHINNRVAQSVTVARQFNGVMMYALPQDQDLRVVVARWCREARV